MDPNTSFDFKEEVINFSWNKESEPVPHPVAGVCSLNVTPCPRICHLILCFLLWSCWSPFNMQQERAQGSWGGCPGIDSISPPCPYSLIAPQQTWAVGNLPAVRAQGLLLGAGLGRLWVRWEELRLFSLLWLYSLPTGETSWLFFLGHCVLLCYLLSFKPSVFSANQAFVCLKQTGKTFPHELQSLCLYLLSKIRTVVTKSNSWPREQVWIPHF